MADIHKLKGEIAGNAVKKSLTTHFNKEGYKDDEDKDFVQGAIKRAADATALSVERSNRMKATNRRMKAKKQALNKDLFQDV